MFRHNLVRIAAACFVAVVGVSSAVALALLAPLMAPVQAGSAEVFWSIACGVGENPWAETIGGVEAYVSEDGEWVAYVHTSLRRSHTYAVPLDDAARSLRDVTKDLEERSGRGEESWFVTGYRRWRDDEEVRTRDLASLVECCNAARLEHIYANGGADMVEYGLYQELLFERQWQRRDSYWATIAFEWIFLTGLALFAVWPAIRKGSPWRWAWHLGAVPLL